MKGMYQKYDKENMARVLGTDLSISTKLAVELCNFVRYKNTKKIVGVLSRILDKKVALPLTRFNKEVPHKRGIAAGAYPQKSTNEFIKLIKSVEANAQDKGLDTDSLKIIHASANKGPNTFHYGRIRGIKRKITHVEIVVQEDEKKKEIKKVEKKEEPKKEKVEKK